MSGSISSSSSIGPGNKQSVSSVRELLAANNDPAVQAIIVSQDLSNVPTICLMPGKSLLGLANDRPALQFASETDGICLSTDNTVMDLALIAASDRRAIWNDESVNSFGRLTLRRVNTAGRVRILARGNIRSGHVVVEGLDIASADARAEKDRPHEYGVDVLQGAFTLWNMQADPDVVITADLIDLSAGRFGAPVLGSGIFVSGAGETGGRLELQHLRTGSVYNDGRIETGTPSLISGGVFVVYGARVNLVENAGPITTYGPNDMALDNWGVVDRWISRDKVTTFGPCWSRRQPRARRDHPNRRLAPILVDAEERGQGRL
jgi:hypothetical protein